MNFIKAVESAWQENNTLLCIGLDPDLSRIPVHLRSLETPLFEFNKAIVDATADLVCSFKPQIAYYSASQAERDLELTIEYIHHNYPGIPVILDAKRGDIGSTAEKYAQEVFDRYKADAVKRQRGNCFMPYVKSWCERYPGLRFRREKDLSDCCEQSCKPMEL
jgi:orotidine-5'-phosphate decarboxylase